MAKTSAIWGLSVTLMLASGGATQAVAADHAHHHGAADAVGLTLNAGKRWTTDAPLRQAMGNIREAVTQALLQIHKGVMDKAGYLALANRIDTEVAYMVSHCRLAPEADAQLHQVIAQIMAGAESMRGNNDAQAARAGVIQVKQALALYGQYFDDPAFVDQADHAGH